MIVHTTPICLRSTGDGTSLLGLVELTNYFWRKSLCEVLCLAL